MSVARCQAEVDSEEFASWQAYDRTIEPVGLRWEPLAVICSLIDSFMGGFAGRQGRPPHAFIPVKEKPRSAEEMTALADKYARAHNKTRGRQRRGK